MPVPYEPGDQDRPGGRIHPGTDALESAPAPGWYWYCPACALDMSATALPGETADDAVCRARTAHALAEHSAPAAVRSSPLGGSRIASGVRVEQ